MKQTIKGWTVGLVHKTAKGYKLFLGRNKSSEGAWLARIYTSPCDRSVYANLFDTADEALEFWKAHHKNLESNFEFTPIPVEIELSVEVKGLGFSWNGLI